MKRSFTLLLAALGAIGCAAAETKPPHAGTGELLAAADAVIEKARTDNVAAAKEVTAVFTAASRLLDEGRLDGAERYYSIGLQLAPWAMDEQLRYAELLRAAGKTDQGRAVARMVHTTAEEQPQLERSAALAGAALPAPLPPLPSAPLSEKVVCVVPIGTVDDWLLAASGRELSTKLGVPVYLHPARLDLPEPDRSFYQRWSENVKRQIAWDHPIVRQALTELGIESADKATPDQIAELLVRLIEAEGRQDARVQIEELTRQVKERDQQWDAARLLEMLDRAVPHRDGVVRVGFTRADLYGNESNYIFGLARSGHDCCLVSYLRFTAAFNADRPNQRRLLDRVHKQLLTSVGFALGVPRPTDPRSARSYPGSLQDHDAKGAWLAPECVAGFERALGHALPEKTRQESSAAVAADRDPPRP